MPKKVNDEKLLEMLLVHGGVKGAADACGLSQNAVYKRMRDPVFRAEYDKTQGIVLSATTGALCEALGDAVKALHGIVKDNTVSSGLRVQAASALLSHGLRYVETSNVLKRLEALEAVREGDADECPAEAKEA